MDRVTPKQKSLGGSQQPSIEQQENTEASRAGAAAGSEIVVYAFQDTKVRTIVTDRIVWFVAADVCRVLNHTNSRKALSRLDEDERGFATIGEPGVKRRMAIVNESGLFALILTSRMPEAKAFRRWITGEVIPSIRKTGNYRSPEASQQKTIDNDVRIKAKDSGVYVVIVSHERHTVRKLDCEHVFAEFDYHLAEILAHSVLTMVGSVEIAKMRNSVRLDQGIAAEWFDQNLKQAADAARRFLWCAQERRHRQAEKPILPS